MSDLDTVTKDPDFQLLPPKDKRLTVSQVISRDADFKLLSAQDQARAINQLQARYPDAPTAPGPSATSAPSSTAAPSPSYAGPYTTPVYNQAYATKITPAAQSAKNVAAQKASGINLATPTEPKFDPATDQQATQFAQTHNDAPWFQKAVRHLTDMPAQQRQAYVDDPVLSLHPVSKAALLKEAWRLAGPGAGRITPSAQPQGPRPFAPPMNLGGEGYQSQDKGAQSVNQALGTPSAAIKAAIQPVLHKLDVNPKKDTGLGSMTPEDWAASEKLANMNFLDRMNAVQGSTVGEMGRPSLQRARQRANENNGVVGKMANAVADVAAGMTTDPIAWGGANALASKLGPVAGRMVSGFFATQMGAQAIQDVRDGKGPEALISGIMAGMAGLHAVAGGAHSAETTSGLRDDNGNPIPMSKLPAPKPRPNITQETPFTAKTPQSAITPNPAQEARTAVPQEPAATAPEPPKPAETAQGSSPIQTPVAAPTPVPAQTPSPVAEAPQNGTQGHSLPQFAALVRSMSNDGVFTPAHKVFDAMQKADPSLTREQFAQMLYQLHKSGEFDIQGPSGAATEDQVFKTKSDSGKPLRYYGLEDVAARKAANARPVPVVTSTGDANAVQDQGARSVLPSEPETTGTTGGERGGVEPGKQGQEATGEVKAETPQSPQVTGAKNATTELERATRGLDPVVDGKAKHSIEGSYEQGKSAVNAGTINPVTVAAEVSRTARALTHEEVGALTYHRAQLINEVHELTQQVSDAIEKDAPEGELAALRAKRALALDQYEINDQALQKGGTEQAAAFNARKMMVNSDYTYAGVETRAKAEMGRRLTDTERDEYQRMVKAYDDVVAASKAKDEEIAKHKESLADLQSQIATNRFGKDAKPLKSVQSVKDQVARKNDILTERTEIKQRLKSSWDKLKGSEERTGNGQKRAPKNAGFADFNAKPGEGSPAEVAKILRELFANHVKGWIAEGNNVIDRFTNGTIVDRVHADLVDAGVTGFSKRDVRDAISGYGKEVTPQNADQATRAVRELNTHMRIVSATEDATAGEKPAPRQKITQPSPTTIQLRNELDEVAQQKGLNDADRLAAAKKIVQQHINDTQTRIDHIKKTGEDLPKTEATPIKSDKELDSLRTRLSAAREELTKIKPGPSADEAMEKRNAQKRASLTAEIKDLERQIAQGKPDTPTPKTPVVPDKATQDLQSQRDALKSELDALKPKPTDDEVTAKKNKQAQKALQKRLDTITDQIKAFTETGKYPEKPASTFNADETTKKLQAEVAAKRKILTDLRPEDMRQKSILDAVKKRWQTQIDDYERRIRTNDFDFRKPREIQLDAEARALRVKREQLKLAINRKIAASAKPTIQERMLGLQRFNILSGLRTLGKLGNAAMLKTHIQTPVEDIFGSVIRKLPIINEIAEKAPRHGNGFNFNEQMDALHTFWSGLPDTNIGGVTTVKELAPNTENSTWADAKAKFMKGENSLGTEFGQASHPPQGFFSENSKIGGKRVPSIDSPANVHGAIKTPAQRAEFVLSLEKRAKFYHDKGLDITDPAIMQQIRYGAYEDSLKAILMNPNKLARAFTAGARILENQGAPGAANLVRGLVPVRGVPANFAGETALLTPGVGPAAALQTILRAGKDATASEMKAAGIDPETYAGGVFQKGLKTLTPEEADIVMRSLKKSGVGAAIMALGFLGAEGIKVGGFSSNKKRGPNDLKPGEAEFFGVRPPSWMTHTPMLWPLQVAATMRDDWNNYQGTILQKVGAGATDSARGLANEIPFMDAANRIVDAAKHSDTTGAFLGKTVKSAVIPRAVQDAAEWGDTQNGKAVPRREKGFTEAIKTGIPIVRNTVPVKGSGKPSPKTDMDKMMGRAMKMPSMKP